MKLVHVMAVAAALVTAPAFAADPETPAAPAAGAEVLPAAAKDKDKMVCKTEEVIGSLIAKKRVCMTAAQWKEKTFRSNQWIDHQTSNSPIRGGG